MGRFALGRAVVSTLTSLPLLLPVNVYVSSVQGKT